MAVLGCLCLGVGLEFVQGEGKGGEKLRQEIVQLRQVEGVQGRAGLLGGGLELPVARLQFLQALEMGRELVGGLHQNQHLRVGFLQQGGEGGAHLLGEHGHQPLGGVRGQATDIEIEAREIIRMLDRVNKLIADATGQPLEKVKKDTDRNFWMSPAEALDYGIVGKLITHYDDLKLD